MLELSIHVNASYGNPESGVVETIRNHRDGRVRAFTFTDYQGNQIEVKVFEDMPQWESA
jgi:hypothetical protein